MILFYILVLLFLGHSGDASCDGRDGAFTNREGGSFSTPFYPFAYVSNMACFYYIKAPRNHVVALRFTYFHTQGLDSEGEMTDYLTIIDGRKNSNKRQQFFGNLGSFEYTSSGNRVNLQMITDDRENYPGFNVEYQFINLATHCKRTTIKDVVTSCTGAINDYVTACQVRCRENFEASVGADTRWRCTGGGQFTQNEKCYAQAALVQECEDTDMVDCPYTIDEIVDFYRNNRLPDDTSASSNEIADEEAVLNTVNSPLNLGRSPGSPAYVCRSIYCRQPYRFKCGRCRGKNKRLACITCRYRTRCGSPPPPSIFA